MECTETWSFHYSGGEIHFRKIRKSRNLKKISNKIETGKNGTLFRNRVPEIPVRREKMALK